MTDVKMIKSVKSLLNMPAYVYVAGFIGAAATYVLYTPTSSKSSKLSKSPTFKNKCPRGLINYGSDCFINVILQSLAASSKVTEWLIQMKMNQKSPENSAGNASQSVLFDTLFKTVARVNKYDLTSAELAAILKEHSDEFDQECLEFYAARDVKGALSVHKWRIRSEEHDCHELFHVIMDALEEEEKANRLSMSSLNYFASTDSRSPSDDNSSSSSSSSKSAFKNPFLGYMATQLECLDCGYKYPLRLESFYSLSLSLPHQRHNLISHEISLIDCINEFFKTEFIGDMRCEKCSPSSNSPPADRAHTQPAKKGFLKKQVIAKLPECLCIQLQRNSWSDTLVKQSRHVQFPLSIRIDDLSSITGVNSTSGGAAQTTTTTTAFAPRKTPESFSLKHVGLNGIISKKSSKLKNMLFEKGGANCSTRTASQAPSPTHQASSYYELKSAIVHYGNAHSGHFIQFRQLLDSSKAPKADAVADSSSIASSRSSVNKPTTATDKSSAHQHSDSSKTGSSKYGWLQISDSDIRMCKQHELLSNNVYMLFYDRVTWSTPVA